MRASIVWGVGCTWLLAACGSDSRPTDGVAGDAGAGRSNAAAGGALTSSGGSSGIGGAPGGSGRGGATEGGGSSTGGAGASGGPSGGGNGTGGEPVTAKSCPAELPVNGSKCADDVGPCTFGNSPRPECRTVATCDGQGWTVTPPLPATQCDELAAGCPESPPEGSCDGEGALTCGYDTAYCWCATCCNAPGCNTFCGDEPEGSMVWGCARAPVGRAPCPELPPNRGASCELPNGTACVSDPCGLNITCMNGTWNWEMKNELVCMATCASPDTPIATPMGDRPIAELREGDLVYSVDHDAIVVVPIARAQRSAVRNHSVLHLQFGDGTVLEISAQHPTADGRMLGDLHHGDVLDGQRLERTEPMPYAHAFTYDILPKSETGAYFAGGVLIGSTLFR